MEPPPQYGIAGTLARLGATASTKAAPLPVKQENKSWLMCSARGNPDEKPRWLERWTPSDAFIEVPEKILREEHQVMVDALVPAGEKTAAIFIAKSLEQFGTPDNWAIIFEDYLDELSQIPADLLKESWIHIRRECKFIPKIADFLEPIKDKLLARKIKKTKLEMMIDRCKS